LPGKELREPPAALLQKPDDPQNVGSHAGAGGRLNPKCHKPLTHKDIIAAAVKTALFDGRTARILHSALPVKGKRKKE